MRLSPLLLPLLLPACVGDHGGGPSFPFPTRTGHSITDTPQGHADRGVYDLGWDIDCRAWDEVGSLFDGIVTHVDPGGGGYGIYVDIRTDDGLSCRLAHFHEAVVTEGQRVAAAQVVGLCGNTGAVTPLGGGDGTHVHVACDDLDGDPLRLDSPSTWSLPDALTWGSAGGVVEVLAPTAGEVRSVGEEGSVAWTTDGADLDVHVEVYRDGVSCELQLAAREPASGAIPFSPLATMGICEVGAGSCGWQVGVSNDLASAFSDPFCIVPAGEPGPGDTGSGGGSDGDAPGDRDGDGVPDDSDLIHADGATLCVARSTFPSSDPGPFAAVGEGLSGGWSYSEANRADEVGDDVCFAFARGSYRVTFLSQRGEWSLYGPQQCGTAWTDAFCHRNTDGTYALGFDSSGESLSAWVGDE